MRSGAAWRIAVAALLMTCAAWGAAVAAESGARANVIAFGLFGDQDVFQSEAERAAAIVAARYGHGGAVIVRANFGARRAAMIEEYFARRSPASPGDRAAPTTCCS